MWVGKSDEDILSIIQGRSEKGESVSNILRELVRRGIEKDRLRKIEQKLDRLLEEDEATK